MLCLDLRHLWCSKQAGIALNMFAILQVFSSEFAHSLELVQVAEIGISHNHFSSTAICLSPGSCSLQHLAVRSHQILEIRLDFMQSLASRSQFIWKLMEVSESNFWQYGEEKRRQEKKREEKRREEKRREEKRREEERKRKSQKKGDTGARNFWESHETLCVFPMICGSGGSKSRLAKAAGVEPSGEMRHEKLHAVVARKALWSQNAQSTPASDHSWKFGFWKMWKNVKNYRLGPPVIVAILQRTASTRYCARRQQQVRVGEELQPEPQNEQPPDAAAPPHLKQNHQANQGAAAANQSHRTPAACQQRTGTPNLKPKWCQEETSSFLWHQSHPTLVWPSRTTW